MPVTTKTKSKNSLFITLVSLSLLLTLITVMLSAYIRLAVNGLGCADWPDCYGRVNVLVQHQGIDVLTGAAASMQHSGIRTLHRLVASVLGIFVVVIAIMALRRRGVPQNIDWRIPLAVLAITVFLSWLGYVTPTPLLPAVTLGNLLGGLAMLALLWWLSQRSVMTNASFSNTPHPLRSQIILGLVLLCIQISLGAWVSAYFAGPACPELVSCSGASWSDAILNIFQELPVDDQGRVQNAGMAQMIHVIHRFGAVLGTAYFVWLGLKIIAGKDRLRTTGMTLLILLALQLMLGIAAVALQLPLLLATAHNGVAALLLLTTVNLLHLVTPPRSTNSLS